MLLLVPLVIFVAYLVFGITGFGASPITIPVLVHLLPLAFVLSLAALLDLGSALARICVWRPHGGAHHRRHAVHRRGGAGGPNSLGVAVTMAAGGAAGCVLRLLGLP